MAYPERPPSSATRLALRAEPSGGELLFLGAVHSNDPFHSQVGTIERELERFRPTVVFYEGHDSATASTRDDTVREYGESGLVRYLAERSGARLERLEPAAHDELAFVLASFSEEEVLLTYVLRDAARWRDAESASPAEIRSRAAALLRPGLPGVPSVASNADELEAAFRRHWAPPRQWWSPPAQWFDPFASSGQTGGRFTNEVMQASYAMRDRHMFRAVVREVLAGERVFAVAGRTHVATISPALRCAVR